MKKPSHLNKYRTLNFFLGTTFIDSLSHELQDKKIITEKFSSIRYPPCVIRTQEQISIYFCSFCEEKVLSIWWKEEKLVVVNILKRVACYREGNLSV